MVSQSFILASHLYYLVPTSCFEDHECHRVHLHMQEISTNHRHTHTHIHAHNVKREERKMYTYV